MTSNSPGAACLRLLIVEDEVEMALSFKMLLEMAGYDVEVAHDATTALALLRRTKVHAVLCDLGLPCPMSGLDLAEAMKRDPDLKEVPLVAVTGYGQPHDHELTTAAGFEAHLLKPVELPELHSVLRAIAARGHLPNPSASN